MARMEHDHKWIVRISNWLPARINQWEGRHWSVKHRLKKADRNMIAACCLGAGVPRATEKRRVTLNLTIGPGDRGGDVDAYWKSVLDALTECGAILGDRCDQVEIAPIQMVQGERSSTTLILQDLPYTTNPHESASARMPREVKDHSRGQTG